MTRPTYVHVRTRNVHGGDARERDSEGSTAASSVGTAAVSTPGHDSEADKCKLTSWDAVDRGALREAELRLGTAQRTLAGKDLCVRTASRGVVSTVCISSPGRAASTICGVSHAKDAYRRCERRRRQVGWQTAAPTCPWIGTGQYIHHTCSDGGDVLASSTGSCFASRCTLYKEQASLVSKEVPASVNISCTPGADLARARHACFRQWRCSAKCSGGSATSSEMDHR
ncbi:hypothetical protein OH76DRAFT_615429 [Lentinus brumalis]|uniref:Uncharacterized protein n=1 Tax=Lentinus brumalis TaxID=2498619 RepID=A0A371D8U6_9APHY|nr:hypothetical protein OH76DRAFT_615429 [Polyporus brumalis]